MKSCKLLFVLLAGLLLAVSSCEKSEPEGIGSIGSVNYNGKRIAMNAPIFEEVSLDTGYDRWKNPDDVNELPKCYLVGISSHAGDDVDINKVTSFYLVTTLPEEDFELTLSPSEYAVYDDFPVYFQSNGKLYRCSIINGGVGARSENAVESIAVDPETGKEIVIGTPDPGHVNTGKPDMAAITSGKVKAEWRAETLHLEFDLKFADGKTATGYGEIPLAVIEK